MNITSAQYCPTPTGENETIKATVDGEVCFVPLDAANRHYQAILEWAEEDGNTIEEAE